MSSKDSLGDRMKTYEGVTRTYLTRRTPVVIRLDGKAFHTFTRGFEKPFDYYMAATMQDTMLYLCQNIQGCVLGYTQSDEITLVLVDYKTLETCPWFDYNIQKCVSVAASMATMEFNRRFAERVKAYEKAATCEIKYLAAYQTAMMAGAMFDARVFNLPKEEVTNCLLWRQNDATRNSIEAVGQAYFSHKELQNKTCSNIQDMLMEKYNVNWNNFPTMYKRGSCCIRRPVDSEDGTMARQKWVIDDEIPIFKNTDYIDSLIYVGD